MTLRSTALIAALATATFAAPAFAQSFAPEVPNPVHPFPENPIATNGAPLGAILGADGVYTGRSAYVGQAPRQLGSDPIRLPFGF